MNNLKELKENFALFDDWEDRYGYLIDLGKLLPPMAEAEKTAQTIVPGCTSQVWMIVQVKEDRLHIQADSDAFMVRGLIAILLAGYQGLTRAQAQELDIESAFAEMGLEAHLSPNRRNGFFAMVNKIRQKVQET